ncbi:ATP-binding cassette domain-containing protein [Mesomycoplasma flocculare]|uniref:ABC transporter ATP-binding protein n=1 Tax=Mesomycoplasma flocculare ATCC 27399 TaxID=743971 RepID=A0A0A8E857_MESFC|nr:ATP-binding cassette domain-containing protein [Mesomycoplasma flocculare]AJC50134.1 ABC transporter ATP-binding protein [Mesomycoplasma flocculare ATCC 27399]ENX51271.1 putative ABC transporter ATP-binding - Pr2-like protein [Mesomycoplasma flocculare ATCC 27716]
MKKIVKLHFFNVFYSLFIFGLVALSIVSQKFLYQSLIENKQIQMIIWLLLEIFAILVSSFLSTLHNSLLSRIFGQASAIELIKKKAEIFDNLTYKEYVKNTPGSYFSLFFNEAFTKGEMFFAFLFHIISIIFPIISILATIFYINPLIGAFVLGLILLWTVFPAFFRKFFSKKIQEQLNSLENFNEEFNKKLAKFEAFLFFNKIHLLKKILKPTARNASFGQKSYRFWNEFNNNINLSIRKLFLILTDLSIILLGIYYKNSAQTIVVLVTINSANQLFINDFNTLIVLMINYLSLKTQFRKSKLNEKSAKKILNFQSFNEKIDLISIENLNFNYQDKLVLKDVNLKIIKGKKYLLQGENGAGKSTFLKILMGIERDYTGKITFNSRDLKSISDENIITNISYLDNNPCLIEGDLDQNISFYSKYEARKIEDLINLVNLAKLKGKILINYCEKSDLSVGQKQLINFASHLIETKPILILDEAFSNLDKTNSQNLLAWLLKQNITLFFIFHNLDQNLISKFDFQLNFSKNQILVS